jgi:Protein of unknown function (DUF4232)
MIAPPKPPSQDDREALIKEARARQVRRRLLGAAGVAIVAALGLSTYVLTVGSNQPGKTGATRRPARAPICRSDQLSGSAGFQGATQTLLGAVTLVNTSATACSLPRQHPLVSISWHGERLQTAERPNPNAPPWPRADVLAPGEKADVYFQWFSCGGSGPNEAVRPTFGLRFGRVLVVSARSTDVTPAFCSGLGGTRNLDVSPPLVEQ